MAFLTAFRSIADSTHTSPPLALRIQSSCLKSVTDCRVSISSTAAAHAQLGQACFGAGTFRPSIWAVAGGSFTSVGNGFLPAKRNELAVRKIKAVIARRLIGWRLQYYPNRAYDVR